MDQLQTAHNQIDSLEYQLEVVNDQIRRLFSALTEIDKAKTEVLHSLLKLDKRSWHHFQGKQHMNQQLTAEMEKAWIAWHSYTDDPDEIPGVNPSFKHGFKAGVDHVKRLLHDVKAAPVYVDVYQKLDEALTG